VLPSTDIRLLEVPPDCAAEGEFSVWRVPGRKSLKHEGARLRLAAQIGHRVLRIVLPQPWLDGSPAAFCVPTGAQVHRRVRAVKAILSLLQRRPRDTMRAVRVHPGRASVWHMHALQALDGVQAGATHRDIAEALFGALDVQSRWSSDGELRAHVRHLIRRGRGYSRGEYRKLLGSDGLPRQGDGKRCRESP
jgi:hypothetical protein